MRSIPDKVFCFYGSWATYRTGNGRFDIEDIDASKCTHLTYSFIGLKSDGTVKILDDWNDVQLSMPCFKEFRNESEEQ